MLNQSIVIPFLVIYHSYVAQTVSLCPIPPHFVKFGNATSFFRIGITSEFKGEKTYGI